MSLETPKSFEGKSGLFAITHDSKIIYIGKAGYSNAVFRESKRELKCSKLLIEHGDLPKSMMHNDPQALAYVNEHCQRYVGIVSEEIQWSSQLNRLLDNAENLLIYELNKVTPLYNEQLKDKYSHGRPFKVINAGNNPADLKTQYSIS
jgi:hypothetical protein